MLYGSTHNSVLSYPCRPEVSIPCVTFVPLRLEVCRPLPPSQPPNPRSSSKPTLNIIQVGCCVALHPLDGAGHKATQFPIPCWCIPQAAIHFSFISELVEEFGIGWPAGRDQSADQPNIPGCRVPPIVTIYKRRLVGHVSKDLSVWHYLPVIS